VPGLYFHFADGHPLVEAAFVEADRRGLVAISLDQFAGHSFRIGAATTAASVGLEDSGVGSLE
jgi:hypothetical protein